MAKKSYSQTYKEIQDEYNKNYTMNKTLVSDPSQVDRSGTNPYRTYGTTEKPRDIHTEYLKRGTNYDSGFGESKYDNINTDPLKTQTSINENRAANQSAAAQLTNSVIKGGIIAATTFADNMIGTIAGIANARDNLYSDISEGKETSGAKVFNDFINNPFSQAMQAIQQWGEDNFKGYVSEDNNSDHWWEQLGSVEGAANIIGEHFLKNIGFMAGAMASGMVTGNVLSSASALKNIRNIYKGAAVKALNGEVLASTADVSKALVESAKNLRKASMSTKLMASAVGAFGESRAEALGNSKDYADKAEQMILAKAEFDKQQVYTELQKEHPELFYYTLQVNPETGRAENVLNASPEAQKLYQERIAEIDKKTQGAYQEVAKELIDYQNTSMAVNLLLTMGENFMLAGDLVFGGYSLQKNNMNLLKKEGGKWMINDTALKSLKAKNIASAISSPMFEGTQEMFQEATTKSLNYWEGKKFNEYYGLAVNPDGNKATSSWLGSAVEALTDTYTSADDWENFIIGALTALLPLPGKVNTLNDDGSVSSKTKAFAGGEFWESMRATNNAKTQALSQAKALEDAEAKDKVRNNIYSFARHQYFDNRMMKGLEENDKAEVLNQSYNKFIDTVLRYQNANQYEELEKQIEDYLTISEDQIDDLKQVAIFKDETGKSIFEGRSTEEIMQDLQDKKESMLAWAKTIREISQSLETMYGSDAPQGYIDNLTYLVASTSNRTERINDIIKELQSFSAKYPSSVKLENASDLIKLLNNLPKFLNSENQEEIEKILTEKNTGYKENLKQVATKHAFRYHNQQQSLEKLNKQKAEVENLIGQLTTELQNSILNPNVSQRKRQVLERKLDKLNSQIAAQEEKLESYNPELQDLAVQIETIAKAVIETDPTTTGLNLSNKIEDLLTLVSERELLIKYFDDSVGKDGKELFQGVLEKQIQDSLDTFLKDKLANTTQGFLSTKDVTKINELPEKYRKKVFEYIQSDENVSAEFKKLLDIYNKYTEVLDSFEEEVYQDIKNTILPGLLRVSQTPEEFEGNFEAVKNQAIAQQIYGDATETYFENISYKLDRDAQVNEPTGSMLDYADSEEGENTTNEEESSNEEKEDITDFDLDELTEVVDDITTVSQFKDFINKYNLKEDLDALLDNGTFEDIKTQEEVEEARELIFTIFDDKTNGRTTSPKTQQEQDNEDDAAEDAGVTEETYNIPKVQPQKVQTVVDDSFISSEEALPKKSLVTPDEEETTETPIQVVNISKKDKTLKQEIEENSESSGKPNRFDNAINVNQHRNFYDTEALHSEHKAVEYDKEDKGVWYHKFLKIIKAQEFVDSGALQALWDIAKSNKEELKIRFVQQRLIKDDNDQPAWKKVITYLTGDEWKSIISRLKKHRPNGNYSVEEALSSTFFTAVQLSDSMMTSLKASNSITTNDGQSYFMGQYPIYLIYSSQYHKKIPMIYFGVADNKNMSKELKAALKGQIMRSIQENQESAVSDSEKAVGVSSFYTNLEWIFSGRFVKKNDTYKDVRYRSVGSILNAEEKEALESQDSPFQLAIITNSGEITLGSSQGNNVAPLNPHKTSTALATFVGRFNRAGTPWIKVREADGRVYYKGVKFAAFGKAFNDKLSDQSEEDKPIVKKIKKVIEDISKATTGDEAKDALRYLHKYLFLGNNPVYISLEEGLVKIGNQEAPLQDVNAIYDLIKSQNYTFTVSPSTSLSLADYVNSGVILTDLAQLHNVGSSVVLSKLEVTKNDSNHWQATIKHSNTGKALREGQMIHLGRIDTQLGKSRAFYKVGGKTLVVHDNGEIFNTDGTPVTARERKIFNIWYELIYNSNVVPYFLRPSSRGEKAVQIFRYHTDDGDILITDSGHVLNKRQTIAFATIEHTSGKKLTGTALDKWLKARESLLQAFSNPEDYKVVLDEQTQTATTTEQMQQDSPLAQVQQDTSEIETEVQQEESTLEEVQPKKSEKTNHDSLTEKTKRKGNRFAKKEAESKEAEQPQQQSSNSNSISQAKLMLAKSLRLHRSRVNNELITEVLEANDDRLKISMDEVASRIIDRLESLSPGYASVVVQDLSDPTVKPSDAKKSYLELIRNICNR